jgi:phage recombination protein Bet
MTHPVPVNAVLDDTAIATLRRTLAAGLNEQQFGLFVEYCRRTGLDPFQHQIHAYERGGRLIMQVGIDGLRLIAARTGELEGFVGPQWAGDDGQWRDVWLSDKPPAAARVGVWRRGFREPVWGVAHYTEFVQRREGRPTAIWQTMPANQLAKCAEAAALRRAFPAESAGLYVPEEGGAMDRVDEAVAERKQGFSSRPRIREEVVEVDRATGEVVDVTPPARDSHSADETPKPRPAQQEVPGWVGEAVRYAKEQGFPPAVFETLLGRPASKKALIDWAAGRENPLAELKAFIDRLVEEDENGATGELPFE